MSQQCWKSRCPRQRQDTTPLVWCIPRLWDPFFGAAAFPQHHLVGPKRTRGYKNGFEFATHRFPSGSPVVRLDSIPTHTHIYTYIYAYKERVMCISVYICINSYTPRFVFAYSCLSYILPVHVESYVICIILKAPAPLALTPAFREKKVCANPKP